MSNSIYSKLYSDLCQSRKQNKSKYGKGSRLHCHHIIPKHVGGTDDADNLTYLTVREHIIAHKLLWRIYQNPNDLRAAYMLGAKLTPEYRRKIGEFCRDNGVGFFNKKYDNLRSEWSKKGIETQKNSDSENTFYYWSTPEGRKKRASLGGKASLQSGNNKDFLYWASSEGRKERGSLGGKAHKGKKCMYKPGDKSFIRVKPEDIESKLEEGYVFGSPISAHNKKSNQSS